MTDKKIILFYKPYGVLSQFTEEDGHPSLAGFGIPKGYYAAGRLDRDSEGLLLLTNEGRTQNQISDPRFKQERTYWVQIERTPTTAALESLRQGVKLQDGITKPCRVQLLSQEPQLPPRDPPIRFRKTVETAWIELTLTEGKNRQVRRMTASVGHPTLRLIRIRHGSFTLKGLKPGEWRYA